MANVEAFNTDLTEEQLNQAFSRALGDYTDEQIDSMIAGKQDTISDLASIRSGAASGATAVQPADMASALTEKQDKAAQVFETGANLDTFVDNGIFRSNNSAKTNSLYNCPVSGIGFIMRVYKCSDSATVQVIFCGLSASGKIYLRQSTTNGFNPWYVFESSTVAPPINVPTGVLNLSPQTDDM